ncbi:Retrovirus-related Pol poly from transposon, partial [Paramuricea clavata]
KGVVKSREKLQHYQKRLLALIWGLENFAPYLVGKQFIARTDHSALRWIKNLKQPKGQVALWIKRLSIFDFVVEHRPGRNHGNADGMSRIPLKDTRVVENNVCKTETAQVFNIPTENRSTTWCPGSRTAVGHLESWR